MKTDNHNEIMKCLGRLEGKMEGVISRLDISNGRISKSEDKIESLALWRSGIVAVIAVAAFAIPLIVSYAR